MAMKWIKLFIQCLVLSTAKCGFHSLQFLSTGRPNPGNQPSFEQLTVSDGVPISHCDGGTKKEEFKPALESDNLPVGCGEASYDILEFLHQIPPLINSTVYVVQRRRGCILSANGSVSAFDAWALNGVDFISFDAESERWTSHSPMAGVVKHRWNNRKAINFMLTNFVREQCPRLIHGIKIRSTQQSTDLRVFAKPIDNTAQALLRCHVTTRQDGNTLDGRHLLNILSVHWKIVSAILGFCCVLLAIIIMSCGITFLLKCVKKKKPRHQQRIDPQLIEEFAMYQRSITSPDLSDVIAAFLQDTERSRQWDQWAGRTGLSDNE